MSKAMFPSLRAMQQAHRDLLQKHREARQVGPDLLAEIVDFINVGKETGRILSSVADQTGAQGLLDYWVTVVYREKKDAPVAQLVDYDASAAPQLRDEDCPYVGLTSFEEQHGTMFFGRRALVDDMVRILKDGNFLTVVGPPGSGRSSLVQAGLLVRLQHGELAGSEQWRVVKVRGPCADGNKPASCDDCSLESDDDSTTVFVVDCDTVFETADDKVQEELAGRILGIIEAPGHRRMLVLVLQNEKSLARFPALQTRIQQSQISHLPADGTGAARGHRKTRGDRGPDLSGRRHRRDRTRAGGRNGGLPASPVHDAASVGAACRELHHLGYLSVGWGGAIGTSACRR